MEEQEPFEAIKRINPSARDWVAACRLREEEALALLKDDGLFPLAGKVMLTALDHSLSIPDETPDEEGRRALILWVVKRQSIRDLFWDLRAGMEPTIRAVSNGASSSLDWLIDRLCQDKLTYLTFSQERLRLLQSYETALAAVKAGLSEHDPRLNWHLTRQILL